MTMKRFLVVAASSQGSSALLMMLSPEAMLGNSLAPPVQPATSEVTRWVGFAVFSLAWIT